MTTSTVLVFVLVGLAAVAQAGLLNDLVKTIDGLDLLEDSVRPDMLANFSSFCQKHGRKFNDVSEMRQRLNNFRANKERVQLRQEREGGTARHGLTKFADFTPEEFVKSFTGHRKSSKADKDARKLKSRKPATAPKGAHNNGTVGGRVKRSLPTNFDWRTYGVVSSVKDQGSCGNCYSFASTAMIESSYSLYYGLSGSAVPNYAESETTDCSTGNYGCNGGWGYKCVEYVMNKPGITSETAYPFSANAAHNSCKLPSGSPRYAKTLAGYWMQSTEAEIAQDLYDYGPIDISIDANFLDTYVSGILDPQKPSSGWDVNHEVLLIGFGHDNASGKDYWIAKNSWNTNWGENGFFRFARGKNSLDILNEPVSIWFDTSA